MKSFFLLFLFLAGAASSVFGGDVFWEYVCESKVLPSDKKKEYAIRSQEAFQAFSQTAKLTPENLDFIRTQGWLRGIDFEQSLWHNPDLSYDALNHVSPQSAVLRTAFEISKGLRGRKEESFFVDLFSSPKLTIQEKIRLLGYFRRNGGNFTLSAKKNFGKARRGINFLECFFSMMIKVRFPENISIFFNPKRTSLPYSRTGKCPADTTAFSGDRINKFLVERNICVRSVGTQGRC